MKKNNLLGFTLMELIVTITILTILMTIGYFSVNGYLSTSRDSVRISDIATMEKSFSLYKIDNYKYPNPDEYRTVTYNGINVWNEGIFGENVVRILGKYGNPYPTDPLYGNKYTYSVTEDKSLYEIGAVLENSSEDLSFISNETYASNADEAYIKGNYGGIMLKAKDDTDYYFLAVPSLITTTKTETDLETILTNEQLVYDGFRNLPSSYTGKILDMNGGFNYNVFNLVLFSGSLASLYTYDGIEQLDKDLKYTYTGTPLEHNGIYKTIITSEGIQYLKEVLSSNFGLNVDNAFNCIDLLNSGVSTDGEYDVDPDGLGGEDPYKVYCDMTTDGGGFTKIGSNYLTNGDFVGGLGITTEWGSNNSNNIVTLKTPIDEINGYAVHQTGSANSEYEVHFDDINDVKSGYEIRLSTWLTGDVAKTGTWAGDGNWDWEWPTSLNHNPSGGYLFHNRLYYTDGTNSINGPLETIDQKIVDGRLWKKQRIRILVQKEPQNFNWFIGYDAGNNTNLYFTDVKMELFVR